MVTGESDHEERFRAVVDFQADYYITKPVTRQALVRLFARYRNDM
jgi:response regulator RpfG family c-di-GMP phosphodiesterase